MIAKGQLLSIVTVITIAIAGCVFTSASSAVEWNPCNLEEQTPEKNQRRQNNECAKISVSRDPSQPNSPSNALQLHVERRYFSPNRRWLVLLNGGPGPSNTFLTEPNRDIDFLEKRFNLLTFDYRGTGKSERLNCTRLDQGDNSEEAHRECINQLGPDRRLYTTYHTVQDIKSILSELNIEKVAVYGVSYGTQVALDLARRENSLVSEMILDSVRLEPFLFELDSFAAIRSLLMSSAPQKITIDPVADLAHFVQEIKTNPHSDQLTTATGNFNSTLTPAVIYYLLKEDDKRDYPVAHRAIPVAVKSASKGDFAPLHRLHYLLSTQNITTQDSENTNSSTTKQGIANKPKSPDIKASLARRFAYCEEQDVPWNESDSQEIRLQKLTQRARDYGHEKFSPFDADFGAQEAKSSFCHLWPSSSRSQGIVGEELSYGQTPTLIIQGEYDIRTPPATSQRLLAKFPKAQLLTVRGVGHAVLSHSSLVRWQLTNFLDGKKVPGEIDARSFMDDTDAEWFIGTQVAPPSTSEVTPIPEVGNDVLGHKLAILKATLFDAFGLKEMNKFLQHNQVPGIHGGTLKFNEEAHRIEFNNYSSILKCSVSGELSTDEWSKVTTGKIRLLLEDTAKEVQNEQQVDQTISQNNKGDEVDVVIDEGHQITFKGTLNGNSFNVKTEFTPN